MRSFVLWIPLCLASGSLAWVETVTEYVTLENSATTSPTSSPSDVRVLAVSQSASTSSSQATFATSFRSSAAESQVSSTSATDSPTTSLIQATSVVSSLPTAAAASSGDYNGGDPGAGSAIDTDAGASGSGSSFSLSRGGMIAIIVVVAIVAIFGIASTVLFVVAKRRQWNVRASIARASRRLTGRFGDATRRPTGANNRRTNVHAGRLGGDVKAMHPPGSSKRGMMRIDVQDVEKGPLAGKAPNNTKPRPNTWVQRLWGNDWK